MAWTPRSAPSPTPWCLICWSVHWTISPSPTCAPRCSSRPNKRNASGSAPAPGSIASVRTICARWPATRWASAPRASPRPARDWRCWTSSTTRATRTSTGPSSNWSWRWDCAYPSRQVARKRWPARSRWRRGSATPGWIAGSPTAARATRRWRCTIRAWASREPQRGAHDVARIRRGDVADEALEIAVRGVIGAIGDRAHDAERPREVVADLGHRRAFHLDGQRIGQQRTQPVALGVGGDEAVAADDQALVDRGADRTRV